MPARRRAPSNRGLNALRDGRHPGRPIGSDWTRTGRRLNRDIRRRVAQTRARGAKRLVGQLLPVTPQPVEHRALAHVERDRKAPAKKRRRRSVVKYFGTNPHGNRRRGYFTGN